MGVLASTTRRLPPGSRTTTSGRSRRSSAPVAVTCSSKSQRASIPACSRTRRSCTSPQEPRTDDALSDPTSDAVWAPSSVVVRATRAISAATSLNCATRSRSRSWTWRSTRSRLDRSGAIICAVSESSLSVASRSIDALAQQRALGAGGGEADRIPGPHHQPRHQGAEQQPSRRDENLHGPERDTPDRQNPRIYRRWCDSCNP